MSDNKKYYYLKLKDNFFESDELIVLESMPDGFLFSNILLKLYLRSLKNGGKLMFNDRIPFNSQMLAKITGHSTAVIEKAINVFRELQLIDILDNGAIYMLDIQNFIGRSTTEADRKREYRQHIAQERLSLGHLSGQMSGQMSEKSPPEIEIEIEKDINNKCPFQDIVAYLNSAAGKNFRAGSSSHRKLIRARWNDGYTFEDFKKVIDNMVANWTGTEFEKYLQPSTLFRESNFDKYLNMTPKTKTATQTNVPEWSKQEFSTVPTQEGQEQLASLYAELEELENGIS